MVILHRVTSGHFVAIVFAAFAATNVAAQGAPRFSIPNSEIHTLAAAPGDEYQIAVGLPRTYGSGERRYPVLVVLDSDIIFGTAAETAAMLVFDGAQELIVVGVGYGDRRSGTLRVRDLTPTVAPEPSVRDSTPDDGPRRGGGAPAFLAFLRERVLPFVEARYRTDTTQRGLFGHSYGGLFALYTLFHAPTTFSRYIVGSPALWWDRRVTFAFEERFSAANRDLAARVFLGGGEQEERPGDVVASRFRMVSNWVELEQRLRGRGYPSLTLDAHLFPGEGHISVVPFLLSRGIRAVYAAPARP